MTHDWQREASSQGHKGIKVNISATKSEEFINTNEYYFCAWGWHYGVHSGRALGTVLSIVIMYLDNRKNIEVASFDPKTWQNVRVIF
jgi:hypothetical protein